MILAKKTSKITWRDILKIKKHLRRILEKKLPHVVISNIFKVFFDKKPMSFSKTNFERFENSYSSSRIFATI